MLFPTSRKSIYTINTWGNSRRPLALRVCVGNAVLRVATGLSLCHNVCFALPRNMFEQQGHSYSGNLCEGESYHPVLLFKFSSCRSCWNRCRRPRRNCGSLRMKSWMQGKHLRLDREIFTEGSWLHSHFFWLHPLYWKLYWLHIFFELVILVISFESFQFKKAAGLEVSSALPVSESKNSSAERVKRRLQRRWAVAIFAIFAIFDVSDFEGL